MAKEYIEREALLDDLRESYHELIEIYNGLTYDVDKTACRAELSAFIECILRVKGFPAADVVEGVRCKDCKFWEKQQDSLQGRCCLNNIYPTGYWHCANGERSENGDK